MLFLFFTLALVVLLIILVIDYVRTRYEHTSLSRRVLALELVLSVAVSLVVASRFRSLSSLGTVAAGLALALPVFAVLALITVEAWRSKKQLGFEREIRRLRKQKARVQQDLDRLRWEIERLRRYRAELEVELGRKSGEQVTYLNEGRRLNESRTREEEARTILARTQGKLGEIEGLLREWEERKRGFQRRRIVLD